MRRCLFGRYMFLVIYCKALEPQKLETVEVKAGVGGVCRALKPLNQDLIKFRTFT
jgi:hypothetical protein